MPKLVLVPFRAQTFVWRKSQFACLKRVHHYLKEVIIASYQSRLLVLLLIGMGKQR